MSLRHPPATAKTFWSIGLLVDMGESRTVHAILNHGNVPQNAFMELLRVRGVFI
jgi:uncharacterized membrane protein